MLSIENIKIEENSYQQLIYLLEQKTELNFKYYRRNFIESRIKVRMLHVNCTTLESYYDYILSHSEEIKKFLNCFNITYTYFFRNWEIYDQFQDYFLISLNYKKEDILGDLRPNCFKPQKITKIFNVNINSCLTNKEILIENSINTVKKNRDVANIFIKNHFHKLKNNKKSVNTFLKQTSLYQKMNNQKLIKNPVYIWSCPCASGEEPYTMAMIFNNLKHQIPHFPDYKIVASDIDPYALNKAKIGIYDENSMIEISPFYKKKYFTKEKEVFGYKFIINEEIKNQVEFIEEDVTKGYKHNWKYDIIFCRYLLIYLDKELRNKFLKIIENQLVDGGLLFLGKTESLFDSDNCFKLIDMKNNIFIKTKSV